MRTLNFGWKLLSLSFVWAWFADCIKFYSHESNNPLLEEGYLDLFWELVIAVEHGWFHWNAENHHSCLTSFLVLHHRSMLMIGGERQRYAETRSGCQLDHCIMSLSEIWKKYNQINKAIILIHRLGRERNGSEYMLVVCADYFGTVLITQAQMSHRRGGW